MLTATACPPPPEDDGSICDFREVCFDWDFALGDHGFMPTECGGGAPVWEYGNTTYAPGAPGTVWGTVLEGDCVGDGVFGLPYFNILISAYFGPSSQADFDRDGVVALPDFNLLKANYFGTSPSELP